MVSQLNSKGVKKSTVFGQLFFNDFAYGGLFLIALEMADFVQTKNFWAFFAVLFLIALQDSLFLIALRGVANIFDCKKVNFYFFDCTKLNF